MTALCLNAGSHFSIDVDNDGAHDIASIASIASIARAFANGSAVGLLHLAARASDAPLDASLAFGRELGALFLTRMCQLGAEERADAKVPPPLDALAALVERAPPMRGGERLSLDVLVDAWDAMRAHVAADPRFVEKLGSPWHVVGKVCFHLAENKGNDAAPFAFLATYAAGIGASGRAQHAPLGRALGESAADRKRLTALLEPVQRAAETSAFVRALVESGEIFHPLAWTPDDAFAFLQEVPLLESAGVVVRVPDWWKARARPRVAVTLGSKRVAGFGAEAMLDFDMQIAVGDETLRPNELKALLAGDAGLRLVKGRWVEVNPDKLREALDHWQRVEAMAKRDGISFLDGMRMLARAPGSVATHLDDDDNDNDNDTSTIDAGAWLAGVLDKLRDPKRSGPVDPGPALHGKLRHYQRDGVAWLHHAATLGLGVCLADDMGLGKTIQVLALMLLLKQKRDGSDKTPAHLLVVPASLLANWRAEAARFAPSLSLVVAHPSERSAADIDAIDTHAVDVVLTTYGTVLRTPSFAEKRFGLVVLDEAQAIKNPGAKQTRAVKAVQGTSRIALTGTPVENRLGDLWSLFDFLSPGLLGNAKQFADAAKKMEADKHNGFGPLRALIKPYILRRMKTDKRVIDDLPEKTEMRAYCTLTKRQIALYADAVRELERDLKAKAKDSDGMKRRGVVLAAIMRMKQICNHPSQLLGDGAFDAADSGKLDRLRELCEPIVARQEKLLCFTQFKEMTAPLHTFLASVFGRRGLVLHGEVAVKKRATLVDEFQRDDGPPFFVLSLKAGGTGLNLTAASHVVHFDRWWNPAVEDQATDRAFRIGQKRNVVVHKLVCQGTLEEKIDSLLADKRALSDDLLAESSERWLTEMSNAELMKIVALDLSKAIGDA